MSRGSGHRVQIEIVLNMYFDIVHCDYQVLTKGGKILRRPVLLYFLQ